jgi:hypothetical protein
MPIKFGWQQQKQNIEQSKYQRQADLRIGIKTQKFFNMTTFTSSIK